MNRRNLVLATVAAASGGGWQWVSELARQVGQYTDNGRNDGWGTRTGGPRDSWVAESRPEPGPELEWDTGPMDWVARYWPYILFACEWGWRLCGVIRNRRSAGRASGWLVELDELARRATAMAPSGITRLAAEHDVSTEQLRRWADAWNMCAAGPRYWARVEHERAQQAE